MKKKCYDIDMPAMDVDFAVVGGGKQFEYITSEDLENAVKLNLDVPLFGLPASIEEMSANYGRVDDEVVYITWD